MVPADSAKRALAGFAPTTNVCFVLVLPNCAVTSEFVCKFEISVRGDAHALWCRRRRQARQAAPLPRLIM